ncbi:helix-hairpin-helix domain-containing protein [Xylophilus rhododendri]|uniref:Helix-hairpin-helix domain-containing protein n=1 Tax=Xylophilus rhododendri TaxID=2697032 RepID=A0A857JB32_9BURK|nr:helix-hairpin-helix domain-containing protein [Xylophilus rhododendri]QHI99948.1 helix-hairpin-helix domain-containing protein [Xylophilus rhododendri]
MFKKIIAVFLMLASSLAFAAADANKATAAELDGISGIGPATSKLILDARASGAFKNWDDFIARVKGVGDSRAAKLSAAGLTIDGASYTPGTTATKPVGEKVKDGAKAAVEKTKELGREAKDKVTGK